MLVRGELEKIERKILNGERLSRADGEFLFGCNELSWLGALADYVRKKICGDVVYYNVNCHVNLTNICRDKYLRIALQILRVRARRFRQASLRHDD